MKYENDTNWNNKKMLFTNFYTFFTNKNSKSNKELQHK